MQRFRKILCLTVALTLPMPLLADTEKPYDEYQVKVALLYNFSKFIEWPSADGDDVFEICVYGRDPYGDKIDVVETRKTKGKNIVIARYGSLQDPSNCEIAVIGQSETYKISEAIEYFQNQPVLTVSESIEFVDDGGVIGLVRDDQRITFEINLSSARSAGLDVSSHLLRIAKRVVESE